ncbi:putative Intraflagellar transport protein 52-like protein [Hypsibius exemplaris]|uniref:Intraflagellar transport protein 52-like protein n=1 Tax=Hypsibius exemplaris TaxID=2072580 RepID=A0A9X6NDS1_HYPEX|nr:putative Intraflagellar transport protein 52-like protein [Hypsibius exemplaris]
MGSNQLEIIFSCGQGEKNTPDSGYRLLAKRLRQTWAVESSKNIFANDLLSRCRLVVFAGSQKKFTAKEFADLRQYLKLGGYLVVLLGSDETVESNLNYLLEEYGMTVNSDSVIRSTFKKYFIPKEALITDGYLQRTTTSNNTVQNQGGFLFPYGSTMKVKSPAIPLLITGSACHPMQKPICGFYADPQSPKGGRILTISSVQIFHDGFIEKEENLTLVDRLFGLILAEKLPRVLPDESDVPESEPIVDIAEIASRVTPVLERFGGVVYGSGNSSGNGSVNGLVGSGNGLVGSGNGSAGNLKRVYETDCDAPSMAKIAEVLQAFREVGAENEPLSLVAPKFDGVYPSMQPAVYPPTFDDLPRPQLEMFDFNKEFVAGREKLNHVVLDHRNADDLTVYINKITTALSLGPQSIPPVRTEKELLEHVAMHLLNFKSSGWTQ